MKTVWQPLTPVRWTKRYGEVAILQQAWGEHVFQYDRWIPTGKHEWRDVPTDIEDPKYWTQETEDKK